MLQVPRSERRIVANRGQNRKGDWTRTFAKMAGMHPAEFFAESIVNSDAVIDPEDKGSSVSLVQTENLACPL